MPGFEARSSKDRQIHLHQHIYAQAQMITGESQSQRPVFAHGNCDVNTNVKRSISSDVRETVIKVAHSLVALGIERDQGGKVEQHQVPWPLQGAFGTIAAKEVPLEDCRG